jgi:hypothetical protein
LLDKLGHHNVGSQIDALNVDVEHSLPLFLSHLSGGLSPNQLLLLTSLPGGRDSYLVTIAGSGIIHHDIQSSELGESQINNGCPVGLLCNIHALKFEVAGVLGSDLLASLDVNVCDQDLCTFLAESTSNCSAKAGASSYRLKEKRLVQGTMWEVSDLGNDSPVTMATFPCNLEPWEDISANVKINYV